MDATDYVDRGMLEQILRLGEFPTPEGLYLAIGSQVPTRAGASPESPWQDEFSGSGYSRFACGELQPYEDANDYSYTNRVGVKSPTATGSWGTVRALAVFDAATLGNMLFYTSIFPQLSINSGEWVTVQPGSLTFRSFTTTDYIAPDFNRQVLEHVLLGRPLDPPIMQVALAPEPSPSTGYTRAGLNGVWDGANSAPVGGFDSGNEQSIRYQEAVSDWGPFTRRFVVDGFGNTLFELSGTGPDSIDAGDTPYFPPLGITLAVD